MKSLTQTMSASTAFSGVIALLATLWAWLGDYGSGAVLILAVLALGLLVNAFALYMYADANHE